MSDRILKGDHAVKGEDFVVSARPLAADGRSAKRTRRPANAEPQTEEEIQLPSDRAHSEAERIVADAEQMAQEIAAEAENKATKKREETENELEQLIELTTRELETQRETIEREIRQRLEAEYRERYLAAVSALEKAAADLRANHTQYLESIEEPALKLVLAVARQLLGQEISQSPEAIAKLIVRAVGLLKPEHVVTVYLHADSHQRLANDSVLAEALRQSGIRTQLVELAVDDALMPDQFSARIEGTSIDYNMSAAVDELAQQLAEQARQQDGGTDNEE